MNRIFFIPRCFRLGARIDSVGTRHQVMAIQFCEIDFSCREGGVFPKKVFDCLELGLDQGYEPAQMVAIHLSGKRFNPAKGIAYLHHATRKTTPGTTVSEPADFLDVFIGEGGGQSFNLHFGLFHVKFSQIAHGRLVVCGKLPQAIHVHRRKLTG